MLQGSNPSTGTRYTSRPRGGFFVFGGPLLIGFEGSDKLTIRELSNLATSLRQLPFPNLQAH